MARRKKHIQSDPSGGAVASGCDDPRVRRPLERIEQNYVLLDEMLADLEARVPESESESPGRLPRQPR